jgi:hypothetical protein
MLSVLIQNSGERGTVSHCISFCCNKGHWINALKLPFLNCAKTRQAAQQQRSLGGSLASSGAPDLILQRPAEHMLEVSPGDELGHGRNVLGKRAALHGLWDQSHKRRPCGPRARNQVWAEMTESLQDDGRQDNEYGF